MPGRPSKRRRLRTPANLLTFLDTKPFQKWCAELGIDDEALAEMQNAILEAPDAAPVVPGPVVSAR